MSCKNLFAVAVVGALVLFLTGSASAGPRQLPPPVCQPGREQPRTHTLTIYNGDQVMQQNFVWENGSWRSSGDCESDDALVRDCPRSPWRCQGTCRSPRRAQEVACPPRAHCNRAPVRHHGR
jgi:hypothetical protein